MFYPRKVAEISARLQQILGQAVPVEPILYDPVDPPSESDSDDGSGGDDEWTASGKVLFQYGPDQTQCDGVQTAMWRLWIEEDLRQQASWVALTDQLVAHQKRQELETGAVAVYSASTTTSFSAKESSTSTYAVYLAVRLLEQEVNQIQNSFPNYYTLYYNDVWEWASDSEPDFCSKPSKSMNIRGAVPHFESPYPTTTITSLRASAILGPTSN